MERQKGEKKGEGEGAKEGERGGRRREEALFNGRLSAVGGTW